MHTNTKIGLGVAGVAAVAIGLAVFLSSSTASASSTQAAPPPKPGDAPATTSAGGSGQGGATGQPTGPGGTVVKTPSAVTAAGATVSTSLANIIKAGGAKVTKLVPGAGKVIK